MPHRQNQYRRENPKKNTRRRDETARTNVVSLRISDEEKRMLEKITKSTSRNMSEIVREALELWLAKRQRLGLEH